MKNKLIISSLLVLLALGITSSPAFANNNNNNHDSNHHDSSHNQTTVKGKVTDGNGNPIKGAQIKVGCNGFFFFTTTNANGDYKATYSPSLCNGSTGSFVTVDATKDGASGENGDALHNHQSTITINVQILNVAVPEFGMVTGVLATLGSFGSYMLLKKKRA